MRASQFFTSIQYHKATIAPSTSLLNSEFVSLSLTTQKNRGKGESIGNCCTVQPLACPVADLHHQLTHLRQHNTPDNTPFATVYLQGRNQIILSEKITTAICDIIRSTGPKYDFTETDVSAWSLRAGRAMAPLLAQVDTDTMCLVRRWRSKTMLLYLHNTPKYFTQGLATHMVQYGMYLIITPAHADL